MSVIARMYVATITRQAYQPGNLQVKLQAVSRGEENKTWAASTPTGSVDLTISNEAAASWFADRLGKDIAITFEERMDECSVCKNDAYVGLSQYSQPFTLPDGSLICGPCLNKRNQE